MLAILWRFFFQMQLHMRFICDRGIKKDNLNSMMFSFKSHVSFKSGKGIKIKYS